MPTPDGERPHSTTVNVQVSDSDALLAFIDRLVKLHERMERGEFATVSDATDELGKILALQEGETL